MSKVWKTSALKASRDELSWSRRPGLAERIEEVRSDSNILLLVYEVDDQIIGTCEFTYVSGCLGRKKTVWRGRAGYHTDQAQTPLLYEIRI